VVPSASLEKVSSREHRSCKSRMLAAVLDETGLGREISKQLKASGYEVLEVVVGDNTSAGAPVRTQLVLACETITMNCSKTLSSASIRNRVIHLWPSRPQLPAISRSSVGLSFYSILFLAQAWGDQIWAQWRLRAFRTIAIGRGRELSNLRGRRCLAPSG